MAWLERRDFVRRHDNRSQVFPTSLRAASLDEALRAIRQAGLKTVQRERYEAVTRSLFHEVSPQGISTDELMLAAGVSPEECFRILHGLEQLGVVANDLGLTAAVSKGVRGASDSTFLHLQHLEVQLLGLMQELAPETGPDDTLTLSMRPMCTELRRRLNLAEGDVTVNPDRLLRCLRSMAERFGHEPAQRSMLQVKRLGGDSLEVRLNRSWAQIRTLCMRRRAVAQVVLDTLLARVPAHTKGAHLVVECQVKELVERIEADLVLFSELRDVAMALEQALLYLHETGILQLDKGRSVFRAAMTIELLGEADKRRWRKEDLESLQAHYLERSLQIHVMHEYARLGLQDIDAAQDFVAAYFSWPRGKFLRKYFGGRTELLRQATTDDSYRRIIQALQHPGQEALVTKPGPGNRLVLAGPGSGKTRVIVHRIAALLRVHRVAGARILALAFNRSAAIELRRRLHTLVGEDARSVTVLTYHAMALRLTGTGHRHRQRTARRPACAGSGFQATDLGRGGPAGRPQRSLCRRGRGAGPVAARPRVHLCRRVPGHQRAAVRPGQCAGGTALARSRGPAQHHGSRGRRPEHLRLHRRERRVHPALPAGLRAGRGVVPGRELPLDTPHPPGRPPGHQRRPAAHEGRAPDPPGRAAPRQPASEVRGSR